MKFPLKALEFPILPLLGALARSCRGAGGVQGSGCARGSARPYGTAAAPSQHQGWVPQLSLAFGARGPFWGRALPKGTATTPGVAVPFPQPLWGRRAPGDPPGTRSILLWPQGFWGSPGGFALGPNPPAPGSPHPLQAAALLLPRLRRAREIRSAPLPALPPLPQPPNPPFSPSASL